MMPKIVRRGFTLIELAIALTVVAMVVGGLSIPISKRLAEQQYAETQAHIDKAVEALVGFAILNGRLPCPDINTSTASGTDNRDGLEDTVGISPSITGCGTGTATGAFNYTNSSDKNGASWGDLPWQTLGLSPPNNADAWSNRLRYAVYTPLATQIGNTTACPSQSPNNFGFGALACLSSIAGSTNPGLLDIRCTNPNSPSTVLAPGCSTSTTPSYSINQYTVFVVYSMGANGWGSTNINSTSVSKPFTSVVAASIPDQAANAPELSTTMTKRKQFVIRPRTDSSSQAGEFDDVLSYMSNATLATKLLNAGVWPPASQLP